MTAGDRQASYIQNMRLSIYGPVEPEDSPAFYPISVLERRLLELLRGASLAGLPLRTRSKVAKALVSTALGYEAPVSFKRTRPRFPSPNLDVYTQKAGNLQVWNEEVDASRRYVIIGLDADDTVHSVRVLSGQELALLDTTGALTSKYQARRRSKSGSNLVSPLDTPEFRARMDPQPSLTAADINTLSPTVLPTPGHVLTISAIYSRIETLVGKTFVDPGVIQERLRGVVLQQEICRLLELGPYADGGQFPDILSQALEVKLQLSRTIDLGLIAPEQTNEARELGNGLRYCDARYAIVYGRRDAIDQLSITDVVVTTGQDFFTDFRQFEGKIQNKKLQIPLSRDFSE